MASNMILQSSHGGIVADTIPLICDSEKVCVSSFCVRHFCANLCIDKERWFNSENFALAGTPD